MYLDGDQVVVLDCMRIQVMVRFFFLTKIPLGFKDLSLVHLHEPYVWKAEIVARPVVLFGRRGREGDGRREGEEPGAGDPWPLPGYPSLGRL